MIQVSWGMIAVLGAVGVILALGIPVAVAIVIRRELRAYLPKIAALSDAMDSQYRAVKASVEVIKDSVAVERARIDGLEGEMKMVKQRVGLIGPPVDVTK